MTTAPDRLLLEGVPRISFFEGGPGCPEDIVPLGEAFTAARV